MLTSRATSQLSQREQRVRVEIPVRVADLVRLRPQTGRSLPQRTSVSVILIEATRILRRVVTLTMLPRFEHMFALSVVMLRRPCEHHLGGESHRCRLPPYLIFERPPNSTGAATAPAPRLRARWIPRDCLRTLPVPALVRTFGVSRATVYTCVGRY
jgi:hypothetical protein